MATNNRGITNYLNTLIFCIIAKAVTVILLVMLLFHAVRKYAYLILTIEVCLVAIIIGALIVITKYEKRKAKQAEALLTQKIELTTCPDYFIKDVTPEGTICKNQYTTPDGKITYIFGNTNTKPINVDATFANVTMDKACNIVQSEADFARFAWTDIKTKCDVM